jgi:VWFA-related protein
MPGRLRCMRLDLAVPAICACLLAAPPQEQATGPSIRATARLVLVPATVTDQKGRFIESLTAEDFAVTDNGVLRKVRLDTPDAVLPAVSVVIAIQCPEYSAAALAKIRRVGAIVQPQIAGDGGAAAVLAFDDEVRLIQGFTSSPAELSSAFARLRARSSRTGKLLDAVAESVRLLSERPANSRRVLITISESRDRGSKAGLASVLESLERANVIVYPLTYSVHATPWTSRPGDLPPPSGPLDLIAAISELARLGAVNDADVFARATGGTHLSFTTLRTLERTLMRAGDELHRQYLLSFVPADTDPTGYHRIAVSLVSRGDAQVQARLGYWPER